MAAAILPPVYTKKWQKFTYSIFSMTVLQKSPANFGRKKLEDVVEKNVLWCRCGLKRIIFPLIVAAGHKSVDVLGLIGARTLAMLNAILSTYCNSSDKSNTKNTRNTSNASDTKNTRNTSNISNASLGMY